MERLQHPAVWSNVFFLIAGILAAYSSYAVPGLMALALIALAAGSGFDHYHAPDTKWTADRIGMYLVYGLLALLSVGYYPAWLIFIVWTGLVVMALSEPLLKKFPSFLVLGVLGIVILTGVFHRGSMKEGIVSVILFGVAFGLREIDQRTEQSGLHAVWHFIMALVTLGLYGLVG